MAAITVMGLQSFFRLPAELFPRVTIPTLIITTVYPGAGPPEIESQVSKPLEEAIGTVGGVRDIFSNSQSNVSIISATFPSNVDIDAAVAEARSKIEAVRGDLPLGSKPPVVAKLDLNALPILHIGIESNSLNLQQLRNAVNDKIKPRLERIKGVARVDVVGGEEEEVQVRVEGMRLAQYGITIHDVVNSLKASGQDVPGGDVTQGATQTDVRLSGSYASLEALRNVQILSPTLQMAARDPRLLQNSSLTPPPLTIADVAEVVSAKKERSEINRVNGRDGVSIIVTKAYDSNTVTVAEEIRKALAKLKPVLPADLKLLTLTDNSLIVQEALSDVNFSLALGAVLAMLVILLFLHNLRGTIIVSLAIPCCMVATYLVMNIAGFSLNQMTLLALSLSVGILVDDSIVILEAITRHINEGKTPQEAALAGRQEIGFADMITTLVDVVVFIPIAFVGGVVGGFFKQFGLTIAFATLFSLVVSFSVTPMLAARWYKRGENLNPTKGVFFMLERLYRSIEQAYRGVVLHALRHRWKVVVSGVVVLLAISFFSISRLGSEFMPGSDFGQIVINLEMPPGSSLERTNEVASEMEKLVLAEPDIEATVLNVGQVIGKFGALPLQGAQYAQITARLRERRSIFDFGQSKHGEHKPRQRTDLAIEQSLRQKFQPITKEAGAIVNTLAVRSVVGTSLPINIRLLSNDYTKLLQFAEKVKNRLRSVPGVLDPDITARTGKPEVRVVVSPENAAQYGIAPALAGAILRASLTGNTETLLRKEGTEIPVRVLMEGANRNNPKEVANIIVGSAGQGEPVTIADIANIYERTAPTNIDRYNGQRVITVQANLAPNVPLGNVRPLIQKEIEAIAEEGISMGWGGDAETIDENVPMFANALILAIVLVYIVMATLFNNITTPFVIMFTLPMALIGAFGALVLTGETLSLVSGIGIIMLIGLMGRNAILLLDYTNTLRRRGIEKNEAIIQAGATRLRPICMTTIATIVGMLPIALRFGQAAEIRAPMAIVVIGGLVVSTLLTLVVIPVLYSLFDDLFGKRALIEDGSSGDQKEA